MKDTSPDGANRPRSGSSHSQKQKIEGAKGRFGTIHISPAVEDMPAGFSERFIWMLMHGRTFQRQAADMSVHHPSKVTSIGKARIAEQNIDPSGNRVDLWSLVYRAAFWFGASSRIPSRTTGSTPPTMLSHLFGARMQCDLTQALTVLPAADRTALYYILDRHEPIVMKEWHAGYSGAMAVARVIRAAEQLNASVVIPLVHVDVMYKIDLFIRLTDPERYVCLQIKSDVRDRDSRIIRLDPDAAPSSDREARSTFSSIQYFAQDYQLTCIPALARMGTDDLHAWANGPLGGSFLASLFVLLDSS